MNIAGSVVLVTGGGSGLGAATARRAASLGAKVAVLDRDAGRAKTIADEIQGISLCCDVASASDASACVRSALSRFGALHVLVHCAGIAHGERTLTRDGPHELERFAEVIRVNLIGTFNMTRLAAAAMASGAPNAQGERGVIVNTASAAAFDGQAGQAAYSASKAGVVGMTLPIARDLARSGIRVVTIAPGLFSTPMLHGLPKDALDSLAQQAPFPARLGEPDEFARLAMHIVDNPMLNGEVVRLDGALRMAAR
ncbi:MAG: SDR family NAD(P)-dependent oxidoreductase [Myxococcales bacterium]|nr:SDR family NAD(P)-dependent oxidoreductase [Myxococcales bacterium]